MRIEYIHTRRMVSRGRFVVPEITWIVAPALCFVCTEYVDDDDLLDLSEIRFKKTLCKKHFREALSLKKKLLKYGQG